MKYPFNKADRPRHSQGSGDDPSAVPPKYARKYEGGYIVRLNICEHNFARSDGDTNLALASFPQ